jgi:prepilin-type N-terminal cleavage/methylation domain-containing protein
MRSPAPLATNRRRGLTLLELLFATAIAGVVAIGMFSVFVQSLKIYDYDAKKLTINRYIRGFTSELTENATFANYALIFPDFSTRANVSPVLNPDTGNIDTAGINVPVEDGQSGDMLLLVFVDPADDKKIKRIVGYYRAAANRDSAGPVRRFEREFTPSSSSTAVALLPAVSSIDDWPQVIELSEGLSDGRLFHNFYGRSVMVNGEIIQDSGGQTRVASNTYNFTISPRG